MYRMVAIALALVLATSATLVAATAKSISVVGVLTGNTNVSASCSVSTTGVASGAGRLFGKNSNGTPYTYPFIINKATTGAGTVTLSGYFNVSGNPPMTLTAAVPKGAQTFKYVINGNTVTYTGTGTVTVK